MASVDIDRGFISKLLQSKDLITVKDNQININFLMGEAKACYKFIYETALESGEVPTVRVFKKKFPTFKLDKVVNEGGDEEVGTEETLVYWCNELRNRAKHNTLAQALMDAAGDLEDLNTDEAYNLIKKTVAYIESEVVENSAVDITKDTQSRVEAYLKRKNNAGITGIPTGFDRLDNILKGIEKGTLTVLIGESGVGKTWIGVLIGVNCMLNGYKVLQLVTEMSNDIMRDRYDALLYSKCVGSINYGAYKSGRLDTKTERKLIQFLTEDLPNIEPPLMLDIATDLIGVGALIEKYKPYILLMDAAYLMEDAERAKEDWLRVTHITRGLKKLAKRTGVPIFISTQADKSSSKKVGPALGDIMYSQAIGQDADNILAIYRDEMMRNDNEMALKILKQREGVTGRIMLSWDFNRMKFEEIYSESNSSFDNQIEASENNSEEENTSAHISIEEVE